MVKITVGIPQVLWLRGEIPVGYFKCCSFVVKIPAGTMVLGLRADTGVLFGLGEKVRFKVQHGGFYGY